VPGVREGIHSAARYGAIPTDDPLRKGSPGVGADGRRGGCLDAGEGAGDRGRDAADLADAGGMHVEKLHDCIFQELLFRHIQLDDAFGCAKRWANVRHEAQEVWLWVAMEATSKVIPVMKPGPRTLDLAVGVVHELCQCMPSGCIPIFASDGLKLYFYALTAHFGHWVHGEGSRKLIWEIVAGFIYAQVKKIHRRRKLMKVEHLMLCGEREKLITGLKALGLSGKINTAFIERLNLTMD
jgi:IS1 family transposase